MAFRPAPRSAPFDDFEERAAELADEFNNDVSILPPQAKEQWSESELQMFFASGGQISPPDNPKLRALAEKQNKKTDLRSQVPSIFHPHHFVSCSSFLALTVLCSLQAEIQNDEKLKEAQNVCEHDLSTCRHAL